MKLCVIAAVADNGVIGADGGLPWRLSGDLRRFKELTLGRPVVMGRKTFASIGRPLPGRPNIVVTRDGGFAADGVHVALDIDDALSRARDLAAAADVDEVFVIGGAAIYEATLGRADRLYLTRVHAEVAGDTHFPDFDVADWREVSRERRPAGDRDDHPYSFVLLERAAHR